MLSRRTALLASLTLAAPFVARLAFPGAARAQGLVKRSPPGAAQGEVEGAAEGAGQGVAQPLAFQPTPQDSADLARIGIYLNGIRTLKARFLQVAPDGGITQGTVWLERPGRMRFEYDPPSPLLLVAGSGLLVFRDSALNQTSNIPLGRTPLGILLADHVALSGEVTAVGMQRQPGQIQVSLVRTATPAEGSLTLILADQPLALRQWMVFDAQRQETRVSLFDIALGGSFDQHLFDVAGLQVTPGGSH